ncbi:MAG TPA: hypothetical protein VIG51_06605 [Candidatus Baltobacteraceae bacterium]|jgi:hypothetical protein
MKRREFFARFPLAQYVACVTVCMALLALVIYLELRARGLVHDGARDFASSFSTAFSQAFWAGAIAGISPVAFLVLVFYPIRIMARPVLTLDESSLKVGGIKIAWDAVGDIRTSGMWGRPIVGISTLNDDAALKRLPFWLAVPLAIRKRRIGALFVIPQLREMNAADLVSLIEEYRSRYIRGSGANA